jgi:uncharacterized repeat protein (TIGR04138 family)
MFCPFGSLPPTARPAATGCFYRVSNMDTTRWDQIVEFFIFKELLVGVPLILKLCRGGSAGVAAPRFRDKLRLMPPSAQLQQYVILDRVAKTVGVWPIEAYEFVHLGLAHTVNALYGAKTKSTGPRRPRHVSGQQLCWGLRNFALQRWGLLAPMVLRKWNIGTTLDFGRIVFSLVEHGLLAVTPQDNLEDFRGVYDFRTAFGAGYRISPKI